MNETPVRVLIADDHPIVRQGLAQVIGRDAGLVVVGEADDGPNALAMASELRPDVLLLDIDMPGMDGFEVVRRLQASGAGPGVVFLTMHCAEDMFDAAMALGVRGFVVKDSAVTDVVASDMAVAAGRHFISPSLSGLLMSRQAATRGPSGPATALASLTPTERRVLRLIAEYKTSKEIAEELFVHYRTIENHRTNICAKLGLRGSHALLKFAVEHKAQLL
jgi:DNA-binding NarL/FixJ family response regulator